jgi:hypothetical protein
MSQRRAAGPKVSAGNKLPAATNVTPVTRTPEVIAEDLIAGDYSGRFRDMRPLALRFAPRPQ